MVGKSLLWQVNLGGDVLLTIFKKTLSVCSCSKIRNKLFKDLFS